MSKNTVILITRDQEAFRRKLDSLALPDLEVLAPASPEEVREQIGRANIMLANPPLAKQYINDAKNVVWMQSTYAGVDAMNAEGLRKDYILTNLREVYGVPVAEYVLAYMLAFEKKIIENLTYQSAGVWKQRHIGVLQGKTLCVLGAGSIGKEIARLSKAFGMRTIGYRTQKTSVEHFDTIYTGNDLKACVAEGDYVVSVLPNTKHTDNLIGPETLGAMKSSAVFINVGRGNAVDEDAVIEATKNGTIAAAVLDVFKEEPLSGTSPLWKAEHVYVTPHMAGYIFTEKEFEIFTENYRRFCAGEELMYRVDFAKGY